MSSDPFVEPVEDALLDKFSREGLAVVTGALLLGEPDEGDGGTSAASSADRSGKNCSPSGSMTSKGS
jgi:hypothetical protein